MNFVTLIGHVGQDPTVRTLESGVKVQTFSLATTEKWKSGNETKEQTTWHNIVAWRWLADLPIEKGNKLTIIGKITNRSYEDKSGETRYITEIVATHIEICKRLQKTDDNALPGVQQNPFGQKDSEGFVGGTSTPDKKAFTDDVPF